MRVLFVVFAETGHVNPMIGIAQHLVRDGHDVAFFSTEDLSSPLAAAGLDVRCFSVPDVAHEGRHPARAAILTEMLNRPVLARRYYRYALVTQLPAQLAALRAAIAAARPDVIATDPLAYAGAIVAEQAAIPWVAVSTQLLALTPHDVRWPYLDYLSDPDLVAQRDRLCAAEGVTLRFALGELVSPWLSTVFATEALAANTSHAICVGPPSSLGRPEPAFPWERLREGMPLVYASFGSQLVPPSGVVEALANALRADEADVVIAADCELDPPAHVTAVRWAPQLALLDRARVMVTHGGAGSVAECLVRGVPMVVVPLGHDQPLQAWLVERAGAGLRLAPAGASSDAIATALRTLLADGPHRQRAREIGRSYAAADGSRTAARLIAQVAATRTPIRRSI